MTAPTKEALESEDASLPRPLNAHSVWSDSLVAAAGLRVDDVPVVSIGGGMGSFVTVDYLRVAGKVEADDIRVVSNLDYPWKTYEYLTGSSQIPRSERIRSDSSSRPDNLWGFPSYAVSEALRRKSAAPLAQVFLEPVLSDYYTPKLGDVLESIKREAYRIRYWDSLFSGEAIAVRKRDTGGFYTLIRSQSKGLNELSLCRSRDVHIAVGYAGVNHLPELQTFRRKFNDYHRVVNAYESHEHIYESAARRPTTILVRGSGIVSSRILERILSDRRKLGLSTKVIHLFRTYVASPTGIHPWSKRSGRDGYSYQGFNYPKSAWGGQLKAQMRTLEGKDRALLYEQIGGTTTPWRGPWQKALREGFSGGWYRPVHGVIENLTKEGDGVVASVSSGDQTVDIFADFIIDCTGLDGGIDSHRLLRDLLRHSGAGRNPLGRLDVDRSFEVRGSRSGPGRIYASGAPTLGGYFPGVDTFLGLQIAAQEIVDDMHGRGYCSRFGPVRSASEWFKWIVGKQI